MVRGRGEAAGIGSDRRGPRFAQQTLWLHCASRNEAEWRSRPISRVLSWTVIPLGAASPLRSSSLPGPDAGHVMRSLFGLAPGGVCRAGLLPGSRCALTAPFHPCHARLATPFGGIFLLHFPSARAAQALPGTVPCGARTFLGILANDATAWPTPPGPILRVRALLRCSKLNTAARNLAPNPGSGCPSRDRHLKI